MAQYVYLNHYSKTGTLAISNYVFYQIAEQATNKVRGAKVSAATSKFQIFKPISIKILKGMVSVSVAVTISKASQINAICLAIQEEIASSLTAFTDMVPFQIHVKVVQVTA
jgi:uncharacterized alkaline shock family protein YloU